MKNPTPIRQFSIRDSRYSLHRIGNVIHVLGLDKPSSSTHTFATVTEAKRVMNNPARVCG